MTIVTDRLHRPLQSVRISVTDKCNLRCNYCMPEEHYRWLERENILSFEEISRLVDLLIDLGVTRFRLTGGEPLLRRNLSTLVSILSQKPKLEDLALTTNGILLPEYAQSLKEAGLDRINLSLDTLNPQTFQSLTRRAQLDKTLEGLEAAQRAGFESIKINTVAMRGINEQEICSLIRFSQDRGVMLRFIEYMDVGGATLWENSKVVSQKQLLQTIEAEFGPIKAMGNRNSTPAQSYMLGDGTIFGIIASTTTPFCHSCDRGRITADGTLLTCLYAADGIDLRQYLRSNISDDEFKNILRDLWKNRSDAGAIERLQLKERGPLANLPILQNDPHLEMHTRGG